MGIYLDKKFPSFIQLGDLSACSLKSTTGDCHEAIQFNPHVPFLFLQDWF
jgi:hypothetical protein